MKVMTNIMAVILFAATVTGCETVSGQIYSEMSEAKQALVFEAYSAECVWLRYREGTDRHKDCVLRKIAYDDSQVLKARAGLD